MNVHATLLPGQMLVPPTTLALNPAHMTPNRTWNVWHAEQTLSHFDVYIDTSGNVIEGNSSVDAAVFLNMELIIVMVEPLVRYNSRSADNASD